MTVDFDAVRRNAKEQGVPLAEITIFYENLTDEQLEELERRQLIAQDSNKTVMGRFMADGRVMFPEKAVGVYSLGA